MLVAAQFFAKRLNFARGIFHRAINYNSVQPPAAICKSRAARLRRSGEKPIAAYKNTVLIYNPRAGKFERSRGSLISRLVDTLRREGHNVTAAPTTGPGTAGAIARGHIIKGADLIVAAGGDGTINEVAEGMVNTEVPLAILPAGTANVLAVETRLGVKPERVAAQLKDLRPRRISVGRVVCAGGRVSRHFLLMAGVGLDAHIVYRVNAALKSRTGKFAYWVASWTLLGRSLPEFDVEVDGRLHRCSFALISKVKNYGGDFSIARSVDLTQDSFEVVLFEGRSTFRYARYFAGLVMNRLDGMEGVTVIRAREIKVGPCEDSRVYVQIDGECAGHLPAEIRIVPDALTVLLAEGYGTE
jgi:diacylglycerol kinase family enzyme